MSDPKDLARALIEGGPRVRGETRLGGPYRFVALGTRAMMRRMARTLLHHQAAIDRLLLQMITDSDARQAAQAASLRSVAAELNVAVKRLRSANERLAEVEERLERAEARLADTER